MRRIIVTDLTRFANKDYVCTAGIDMETGECIRPLPYIKTENCKKLNILPGAILEGQFNNCNLAKPHIEDSNYSGLRFMGPCSPQEFKDVLDKTLFTSVSEGFNIQLDNNQKHILLENAPERSIITIKVDSDKISILEDQFTLGKVKLSFTDKSGHDFRFLAITDLGFHDYAMKHKNAEKLHEVQTFVSSQKDIYLRIGLSRQYKSPDGREGYWLQVNGIYTFPDFQQEIRSY